LWRTITEHDAVEITKQRHRDIYTALRAGDAEQASAADLLHLADGERWLQRRLARGQSLRGPDPGGKGSPSAVRTRPNGGRRPNGDRRASGDAA
jgi:hypothetical protein